MMEAWNITNTDIGMAFSAYGITAMISYVVGGPLVDKFAPRGVIAISLLLTALGSSVFFFNPSPFILIISYGLFGISTILFMWSAMIKVTHEIGGEKTRATAMGILEGGRGLVAAIMSSFLVFLLGMQTGATGELTNKVLSLKFIYFTISIFMLLVAVLTWFFLKNSLKEYSNDLDIVEKPLSYNLLYFIVSKKNPNAKEIIEKFNYGLKKIRESGKYMKLLEKYNALSIAVPQ